MNGFISLICILKLILFFFHLKNFPVKRSEFEKRRRMHYNEGEALKLARKLIEEDEDEDDDANNLGGASSSSASNVNQCIGNATETAEIVTIPESSSIKPPTIEIDMESEKS